MNAKLFLSALWLSLLAGLSAHAAEPQLASSRLGSTRNVHAFGKNLLCGQPTAEEFAEAKRRGVQVVVTLRPQGESGWDESATIKKLGMQFHRFGFRAPETLTDPIFDGCLRVLAKADQAPVMLHCASANRVGAIWLAHRVLHDGVSVEAAKKEAKTVGLRTAAYEEKAWSYIRRRQAKSP